MATINQEGTGTDDTGTDDNASLRDTLEAAFAQHSADDSGADAPAVDKAKPIEGETEAQAQERVRDAAGRFAPKTEQAADKTGTGVQVTGVQQPTGVQQQHTPAPPPGELKAPASWTPTAREKWAALDPEIRAEVHRREGEAQKVLQQSAQARQFVDAFESVVRPYEVFIRTENSNPLQAVHNLMSTAAEFRVGTPARKVELVAGIIKNFGIDIEALDTVLSGGGLPAGGGRQMQQEFRDPRLDQLLADRQREQEAATARERHEVAQQMQAFAATHEFYGDVQGQMADLLELAARRGEPLDIEKAYQTACKLHDGVSTILATRAAAPARGSNSQAVLRAKRAAVSIKGDSTPHDGAMIPKDDSVRAAIEAAIDVHSHG
jgi:hypothetical protein